MSSKDRNDGWATPKRCQSMEKDLHFMNLKPHDVTVAKDSPKKKNGHRDVPLETPFPKSKTQRIKDYDEMKNGNATQAPFVKASSSKSTCGWEDQLYQQKSSLNHQLVNTTSIEHLVDTNTGFKYERSYEPSKPHHSSHVPQSEEFVEVKDGIIDQKNVIIRKQKSIISQLRQTNMELEELLIQKKHELRSSNNDRMQKHLREYQHDISLLKQQVAEARTAKASEIGKLQRQLGKSEYEFGKLEIALKEMEISKSGETGKIMKELKKKELELKSEQQKNVKVVQEIKALKHQNQKLQTYLEDLATAEELKELQTELKNLKNEKDEQHMKYQLLEREINDAKVNFQDKDMACKKLQLVNIEQRDELNSLKTTVKKYRSFEEQGGLSFEEQEDIVGENVRLHKENVELRLSLQKRQHKIDDLFKENVQQKIQYEENNAKVIGFMETLQAEAKEKDIALTKITAMNQEILSESLKYQSDLKVYQERYNDEFQRLLGGLGREMGLCVDDVKSFLILCKSRIKGDEPSLNSLLGLRDSPDRPDHPPPTIDVDYIKSKHKEMAELRKDVDALRHLVSEHYAQEIGDNLCITQ